MSSKVLIWGGMTIGSIIGGFIPYIWNGDFMTTILWNAIGGAIGIWAGYKFAKTSGTL